MMEENTDKNNDDDNLALCLELAEIDVDRLSLAKSPSLLVGNPIQSFSKAVNKVFKLTATQLIINYFQPHK